MSCVDDGFVVTSGSQLAVQRALQVSTASDWQTGTEQRKEREREREREWRYMERNTVGLDRGFGMCRAQACSGSRQKLI